jgi:hypothetical protein
MNRCSHPRHNPNDLVVSLPHNMHGAGTRRTFDLALHDPHAYGHPVVTTAPQIRQRCVSSLAGVSLIGCSSNRRFTGCCG